MKGKIHHFWNDNRCLKCGIRRMSEYVYLKDGSGVIKNRIQSKYYIVNGEKQVDRPDCTGHLKPLTSKEKLFRIQIDKLIDSHKDDPKKTMEPFPFDESGIVRLNNYKMNLVNSMVGGESLSQEKKSKLLTEIGAISKFMKNLGDQWINEILLFNPTLKQY